MFFRQILIYVVYWANMIDFHVEINILYNILLYYKAYKTTIHNQEQGINKWHKIDNSKILSAVIVNYKL